SSVLESLGFRSDGQVRLGIRRGATSQVVDAPYVVLALPFTLLREVHLDLGLPRVKRKAIAELGYGTNAKLMVGFAHRVWRTAPQSNGSLTTDLPHPPPAPAAPVHGGDEPRPGRILGRAHQLHGRRARRGPGPGNGGGAGRGHG